MDERIRRSRRQERRGARDFGGTVNAGSGNGTNRKNDVRTDTESIEFKTTLAAGFRLKLDDLKTASRHALLSGRRMVFGIEFHNAVVGSDRYVVLEESDYLEMKHRIEELEDVAQQALTWFEDHGIGG